MKREMPIHRFSDEEIAFALRQIAGGTATAEVCWQMAITEDTLKAWNRKYRGLDSNAIRELRSARDRVLEID